MDAARDDAHGPVHADGRSCRCSATTGSSRQVAGDHQNVLKILPPLITTEEQADEFVDAIDDVLGDLERSLGLLFGVGRSLAIPALKASR